MRVKEESEKAGLRVNIKKIKIMACPIISWANQRGKVEAMMDFISEASKSLWIVMIAMKLRHLLLKRKAMTNSILKSRDITLPTKVHIVKTMIFPVVMYGCQTWTIKKAEHWRVDAFKLWCWRRLLRVPWTAWRSNQPILKEINLEYSLEELMLKVKVQYFGYHLTHWKTPWFWKRLRAGGGVGDRGWHGWMASPIQWAMGMS